MKLTIKFTVACTFMLLLNLSQKLNAQESFPVTKSGNTVASESIKPLRVGVKAGIPSVYSINVEYVTPLLEDRVAIALDYLPISYSNDDVSLKLRNFEFGTNVYLKDTGKGLYGGISYFKFNSDADVVDVDFDDGTFGEGKTSLKFNTLNVKVGVKLGRTFFFRAELGYGFGKLPNEILIKSKEGTGTSVEPIEDISVLSSSGLPVFNFGIGFAFL